MKKLLLNGAKAVFDSYKDNTYHQGVASWPIDSIVHYLPSPNHIKIDVDGSERNVINGMRLTLGSKELKSVLVEISKDEESIKDLFKSYGFFVYDKELVSKNRQIYNFIFKKSLRTIKNQ